MDAATARARLDAMLLELRKTIARLKGEHPGHGESGFDKHPADAGANLFDADRIEAALEALERQRDAVTAALGRLAAGTYGQCVSCGKPVAEGRLEARPEAARCVTCQAKYDRTHR